MSTTTLSRKRANEPMMDSYLKLVRKFPLRPLRSQRDYDRASAVLDGLAVRGQDPHELDAGEKDYLGTLELLIEAYDDEHAVIDASGTPLDNLKVLIQQNDMNTAALGDLLGNRGLASLILNGKRELSKAHIRILATHFHVSPALFI